MAFKHISLQWSAKGMIMGHVGARFFFAQAKNPYHQVRWVIRLFCTGKKPTSPHSEHWVVLPLTPHMVSNRQTGQIEKYMINRL